MHYKSKFVRFLLESGALTFGDFDLKNGRRSPYLIDTCRLGSGVSLSRMGGYYARSIYEKMEMDMLPWETTVLYGLPCKGVALAAASAVAMAAAFEIDLGCSFNRKGAGCESNDFFVGKKPGAGDKVLIIDDVMTSGTALRDAIELIREYAPEAEIVGAIIAVDRKERGRDKRLSAVAEAEYELGIPIFTLTDIDEILAILKSGMLEHDCESEYLTALPTIEQIAAVEDYLTENRAS